MTQHTASPLQSLASSGAVITTKTRRTHRKSRNGCTECKHRHIRCDERHPRCANCEAAERTCSFLMPRVDKHEQRRGYHDGAKRRRPPVTTVAPSPDVEAHSDDNARTLHNTDSEHAEQSSPRPHQRNNHSDLCQATDRRSHRSESWLMHHPQAPPIRGIHAKPDHIPSPASPVQPGHVHTPHPDCCPGLLIIPDRAPKPLFTPEHMVLLHHASAVPNLAGSNNRNAVDIAIRHAIDSPYLIDEVLAFTAFYLMRRYPGSALDLRRIATELQTRALNSFTRLTEMISQDDKATAVPRFLFSGILGRHVLADTLQYCRSDFNFFIDRFVECINLNRGIRAVTPTPAWEYLHNSEMQPFLSIMREAEEKIVSSGTECDALSRLMDDSDLNQISVDACRQAIILLQRSFDICHGLSQDDYPQAASMFPVRIAVDFIDVLRKHRPEALVILAYYGVLLYRCRSFWAFKDTGASLIRAIAGQLGTYWQDALAWPLHVLEMEYDSEPVTPARENDVLEIPSHVTR